jgi:hypothetical protein
MLKFPMRPLSAGGLTPAGGFQVSDEFSDFARHCVGCAGRIERSPSSILTLPKKQAKPDPTPTFFSPFGPLGCYIHRLIMTVIETIMRDIQSLSLREQVEVARCV